MWSLVSGVSQLSVCTVWSLVSGVNQPSVHTVWSLVSGGVSQAVAATTEQLREAFKARFILEISFSQQPLDPVVYGPVEVRCITGRAWWSRDAYVSVTRKQRDAPMARTRSLQ